MTRVAFFDLADQTGIAHDGRDGEFAPVMATLFIEPKAPREWGWSLSKLATTCRVLITVHKIKVLAYESVMGARAQVKCFTPDDRIAFSFMRAGVIEQVAEEFGIESVEAPVHTIRKNFCGQATAKAKGDIKEIVMARCRQLGWKPQNFDEADACAGWWYVKAMTDPKFGSLSTPLMAATK